jgi:small-conductance mechanosensitive channel
MDDPLLARFIARLVGTSVIVLAILVALRIVGLGGFAVGLLSTAGVGAFVIGFAFKDIGENFLAGIVLAFKRPFRVGDIVELNGLKGKVITLNMRDTQIKSFDGKDIYLPNANVVKNPVINYTIDGYLRDEFTIGLDYASNMEEAVALVQQVLENHPVVLKGDKNPMVAYGELTASTINIIAYYWFDVFHSAINGVELKKALVNQVLDTLNANGFYLPSQIVEIKTYKDQQLNIVQPNNNGDHNSANVKSS